jgi:thiamine-phosphate pyrophosphorylase
VIVRHHSLERAERGRFLRRVRRVAATRKLLVLDDKRARIARVHSAAELRSALLARAELVFLSPIYPTCTHPDWRPLHRLRAAAILQLTRQPVLALGGMDARRFGRVRALGFAGFGAIDAWLEARRLRT